MTDTPLQPDIIRNPGEPAKIINHSKKRYVCTCKYDRHYWFGYFDESPDYIATRDVKERTTTIDRRMCPGGNRYVMDTTWVDPNKQTKTIDPDEERLKSIMIE